MVRAIPGCAAILLAGIGLAFAQGAPPRPTVSAAANPPAATAPPADPVVARVGKEAIRLSEINELKKRNTERYVKETGRAVPPGYDSFFLRAGLEEAVRQRLITLDARQRGMTVNPATAESLMMLDAYFRPGGKFDRARFDTYRRENPNGFADARAQATDLLLYQRRLRELERQFAPDARTLDAIVVNRGMTATMRYVTVSESNFDGRTDPTDDELRAFYEKHKASMTRPAELGYTAITVPFAGTADSDRAAARARAHELRIAAKTSAAFDSLGRVDGVVTSAAVWRESGPGGVFERAPDQARAALALAPGTILADPIESAQGLSIVRVDRVQTQRVPTLTDVAADLRARWRAEHSERESQAAVRQYYDSHPDSFQTPSWSVRWARVDSARVRVRPPKDEELQAWFELHKNEFARLDPSGGGVQLRTFEEVRPQVEARWRESERARVTRELADGLAVDWAKGKSGTKNEAVLAGGPAWIVAGGALPEGMPRALADTARAWVKAPRAVVLPDPAGYGVVALVRYEPKFQAPFDVVEPRARDMAFSIKQAAERAQARAWFEHNKDRYKTGPGYAIAYALSPPPALPEIDVSPQRVEAYYRDHIADFSTPTEVRVRHILIGTSKRSVDEARALAQQILNRVRAGEDFAELARTYSEDPGSRDNGGDLGYVRRGQTVPEFDRAVFALSAARPVSGLVQTEFGFHIIKFVDKKEGKATPFADVRDEVGRLAAAQQADTLAHRTADAFRRAVTGRTDMLQKAEEAHLTTGLATWHEGLALNGPAVIDQLREDARRAQPGTVLPRVYSYLKQGYVVVQLDSVLIPRPRTYEEVEEQVLSDYRREGQIAAARTRADRLAQDLSAGRPWAEAIETIGGEIVTKPLLRGEDLPTTGPLPALDSLVYGPGPDTLKTGGWTRLSTRNGELFVHLDARAMPAGADLAHEREVARQMVLNRRIYDYVEDLRRTHPVTVLRSDLAERLPPPPML